jgi:hypothetical protein
MNPTDPEGGVYVNGHVVQPVVRAIPYGAVPVPEQEATVPPLPPSEMVIVTLPVELMLVRVQSPLAFSTGPDNVGNVIE